MMPAAISVAPTKYMNCCPEPGAMSLIQGARYPVQSTMTLKNLSMPNAIGAMVNASRMSVYAWYVGSRQSARPTLDLADLMVAVPLDANRWSLRVVAMMDAPCVST